MKLRRVEEGMSGSGVCSVHKNRVRNYSRIDSG